MAHKPRNNSSNDAYASRDFHWITVPAGKQGSAKAVIYTKTRLLYLEEDKLTLKDEKESGGSVYEMFQRRRDKSHKPTNCLPCSNDYKPPIHRAQSVTNLNSRTNIQSWNIGPQLQRAASQSLLPSYDNQSLPMAYPTSYWQPWHNISYRSSLQAPHPHFHNNLCPNCATHHNVTNFNSQTALATPWFQVTPPTTIVPNSFQRTNSMMEMNRTGIRGLYVNESVPPIIKATKLRRDLPPRPKQTSARPPWIENVAPTMTVANQVLIHNDTEPQIFRSRSISQIYFAKNVERSTTHPKLISKKSQYLKQSYRSEENSKDYLGSKRKPWQIEERYLSRSSSQTLKNPSLCQACSAEKNTINFLSNNIAPITPCPEMKPNKEISNSNTHAMPFKNVNCSTYDDEHPSKVEYQRIIRIPKFPRASLLKQADSELNLNENIIKESRSKEPRIIKIPKLPPKLPRKPKCSVARGFQCSSPYVANAVAATAAATQLVHEKGDRIFDPLSKCSNQTRECHKMVVVVDCVSDRTNSTDCSKCSTIQSPKGWRLRNGKWVRTNCDCDSCGNCLD
ncbi:hypothetical protein ACOME3_004323 [Neoechinorhynchus agilis]